MSPRAGRHIAAALLALGLLQPVRAAATSPLTAECMHQAATFSGVDPVALWLILRTEGGALGTVHRNADGSDDFGPFQINSRTLASLADRLGLAYGYLVHLAKDEGCPAVFLASFVLREKIDGRHGGDIWDGLADYNSRTPAPHAQYLARLRDSYRAMIQAAPDR